MVHSSRNAALENNGVMYTVWKQERKKRETHLILVLIQSKLIKIKALTPVCLRTIPGKID